MQNNISWLFKMAWRDSRRNRSRLLLFISPIIAGIAALVAINSFSDNLQNNISGQAKTLLGADLVVSAKQEIIGEIATLLDSIGGIRSSEINFGSMALFPKTGKTRLVHVRAMEGDFPFYGTFLTAPVKAATSYKKTQSAVLDKTLMIQFDVEIGDTIKIGGLPFLVEGQVLSVPGQADLASSIAPAVYLPLRYIAQTSLIQRGSRVAYKSYFKFDDNVDVEALADIMKPRLKAEKMRAETVNSRQRNIARAFGSMNRFLNLVAFVALLLGCIGVASSVHIYVKEKLNTVAILRCLGASGQQAFLIYLIQIAVIGFVGAVIGTTLGSALQLLLPAVLKDFLPLENITTTLSFSAIAQGIWTGVAVAILFALLPLLGIWNASPLRTLRSSIEENDKPNPLRFVVYAFISFFIVGFSFWQMGSIIAALGFTLALGVAFLLLIGMAKILIWAVRKFFPTSWSYVWRQSLANLYRPNNQTLLLIVSIGLGTMLISTLMFTQELLLKQVSFAGEGDRPNMMMYDIQPSQVAPLVALTKKYNLPILHNVPIVTMRLAEIRGKTPQEIAKEDGTTGWALRRENRVTYRDSLTASEEIIEGQWHGKTGDTIFVSLEQDYADGINVSVGDPLVFNVQGAMIKTYVGSIRSVDFRQMQTNFLILFPTGVLEKAPRFHVITTRTSDKTVSAKFQQNLVEELPNVSAIDLSLILKTVDDLLGKVSFVIHFMALFSIFTGLLVLISSVIISKFQRIQESVLLRTLGASRRQILTITALEYGFLGILASFTGIILSIFGSWALSYFSFNVPFTPSYLPALLLFVSITALTVVIGLFNSREILNKPPLEVLRKEV